MSPLDALQALIAPVTTGIIDISVAQELLRLYFSELNVHVKLLDPLREPNAHRCTCNIRS